MYYSASNPASPTANKPKTCPSKHYFQYPASTNSYVYQHILEPSDKPMPWILHTIDCPTKIIPSHQCIQISLKPINVHTYPRNLNYTNQPSISLVPPQTNSLVSQTGIDLTMSDISEMTNSHVQNPNVEK